MTFILSALAAALPNVFMAILSKLVTQSFLQSVIEKTLIYGLKKAAAMSTNTVDDEIVEEVVTRLRSGK